MISPHPVTERCITLVGMAGAGKSTLGHLLAEALGWAHLDTDRLMEAHYGRDLAELLEDLGPEGFTRAEENAVAALRLKRVVISTGGSVVYGPRARKRLGELGPVVFLRISRQTFLERLGPPEERGFVVRPGCTLEDVFDERQPLYEKTADFSLDTDRETPEKSLKRILGWLEDHPTEET